ncbi:MAG: hypothetical protein MUC64_18900, partial [Rubritepida sp.]|nr:hypothetical protein [Rubritepida sp.]
MAFGTRVARRALSAASGSSPRWICASARVAWKLDRCGSRGLSCAARSTWAMPSRAAAPDHGAAEGEMRLREARVQRHRFLEQRDRLLVVVAEGVHPAEDAEVHAVLGIEPDGIAARLQRLLEPRGARVAIAHHRLLQQHVGEAAMGAGEAGVERDGAAEHRLRLRQPRLREAPQVEQPALVAVPGAEAHRRAAHRGLALEPRHLGLDRRRDLLGHGALDVEHVG